MKRAFAVALAIVAVTAGTARAATVTVPWPQTNGRVRAVEAVGSVLWIAGKFTSATDAAGTTRTVGHVAAFDLNTGTFASFSVPRLGGTEVWDMAEIPGGVILAGIFNDPSNTSRKNLVATGQGFTNWYPGAPALKAVLPASSGVVYAGGKALAAWSATRTKLWSGRTPLTIDSSLRGTTIVPAYRDIIEVGAELFAACQCDTAGGSPSKALIRLDQNGNRLPFDPASAGSAAFGISVASVSGSLFLGAGGSDYFARYAMNGSQIWKRDTSGSAQTVEPLGSTIMLGGHFWHVADATGDACGSRTDPDPNGQCAMRKGLAEYDLNGNLTSFRFDFSGKHNLVWAIDPTGALHVGGEFTRAEGVLRQNLAKIA